jgi:RHS repeat-associated protein
MFRRARMASGGRVCDRVVAVLTASAMAGALLTVGPPAASASTGSPPKAGSGDPTKVKPLSSASVPVRPLPGRSAVSAASRPGLLSPRAAGAPVAEMVAGRDANTRVFRNDDGSLTVDAYLTPIHYPTRYGWVPIDNTVKPLPGRPGWVGTSGNAWTVAFGPATAGLELQTPDGTVSVTPVAAPATASSVPSTVSPVTRATAAIKPPATAAEALSRSAVADPGVVDYQNVWPGVSLRSTVRSDRLVEDIVLAGAKAGNQFVFTVTGTDLTVDKSGAVRPSGKLDGRFVIPAPVIRASDGSDVTAASKARHEVRKPSGATGQQLAVILDAKWLAAQPAKRFPLTVDPEINFVAATGGVSFGNQGGTAPPNTVQAGVLSGQVWRAGVYFQQYQNYFGQGWRVYNAMLQFRGLIASDPQPQVFEQTGQPISFGAIGTNGPAVQGPWNGVFVTVQSDMDRWVTSGLANQWFGIRQAETGSTLWTFDVRLLMSVYKPPQPSFVTNLANNQVLSTTTPTLQAHQVAGSDDGIAVPAYDYQITTGPAPGAGLVVSSGELRQPDINQPPPFWQVPVGVLQEGVTYYAWVLTDWANYQTIPETIPSLTSGVSFKVKLGLGDGGPSPTDQVGSVPGQSSSPSQGAPNPSLPGSKLTVNLVDGNASVSVGTTTMGTLSGGLALGFSYNSLAVANSPQGLRADFYNDTNNNGIIDSADALVGERIDSTVGFDFGSGILAKAVAAQDPTRALGRWGGFLALPAGSTCTTCTWQVGTISSDGLKVTLNNTVQLDDSVSHAPEAAPVFGPSFTATAGQSMAITVDWHHSSNTEAVAQVFVRNMTDPNQPVYGLSPSWLTHSPKVLPAGWTFSAAAGSAQWVGLADRGTSVSVFSADGTAYEFKASGNGGYIPPAEAPNELLRGGGGGQFILQSAGGITYTFTPSGALQSMVTAPDDQHPAALVYGYTGSPPTLRTITDPVSNRVVNLSYGGDTACTGAPAAAAGLLCNVAFWDGTATALTFDSTGRLTRIINPGASIFDFAYDATNRLTDIRDPLTLDAIAAGVRSDCPASGSTPTCNTQLAYDGTLPGRVSQVTQPAPAAGSLRPTRTYSYDTVGLTGTVVVAGLSTTAGFAQRVGYDNRNRITASTDAAGLTTHYTWDSLDRQVTKVNPAGLETSIIYDTSNHPTVTYGPAPSSSFQSNGLPQTNAIVPTSTKAYDGGIAGLGAAWYPNPGLLGTPAYHTTSNLAENWPTGTSPSTGSGTPGLIPPSGFSGRLSGQLTLPSPGRVNFDGNGGRVYVDDHQVIDQWGGPYSGAVRADRPADWWRLSEATGTTAADSAGTNPGTYAGAVTLGQSSPVAGDNSTSASFNGTTGTVAIPDVTGLRFDRTQAFSTEAWVKTTIGTGLQVIASKLTNDASFQGWELGLYTGKPYLLLISNWSANAIDQVGAANLADGNWHHLVATYDGTSRAAGVRFSVDGVADGTGTTYDDTLTGPTNSAAPLNLGSRPGNGIPFNGNLANLAIFRGVLPAGRIAAHHTAAPQTSAITTSPTIWNTPYPQAVANDTPVAYWRLGEPSGTTAADSQGTNTGTYLPGMTLGQPGPLNGNGDPATAAAFNGTTGYVSLPQGFTSLAGGFTIEAWVYPTAAKPYARVAEFGQGQATNNIGLSFGPTGQDISFGLDNSGVGQNFNAPNVITLNAWQHVAATYSLSTTVPGQGTVTLYLNGVDIAAGVVNVVPAAVNYTQNAIGKSNWTADPLYAGRMADIAVYNQAIGGLSIAAHYLAGLTAPAAGATVHRITVEDQQLVSPGHLNVTTTATGSTFDPNYGLVTQTTDPDGKINQTLYSDATAGIGPQLGLATASIQDPAGLNRRTTTTYETPGPGTFLRRVATTLPAGNQTAYTNYGGTEGPQAAVCGVTATTPQGGQPKQVTGPDPGAPSAPRVEQWVYDSIGRQVGHRVGTTTTITSAGWACTTYDSRGRMTSQSWPAFGSQVARTVTYVYAVGGNPFVNQVTDSNWGTQAVSAIVDLLGRTVSYSDIWANVTTTSYDQAGRQTGTVGPQGPLAQNYDPATGRPSTTTYYGSTTATAYYDTPTGRLSGVAYVNGVGAQPFYDTYGRQFAILYYDKQAATGDIVTRSLAGRIIDQQVYANGAFVDATPGTGNNSYSYDGAGRLTQAALPGVTYNYGYGLAAGCPANGAGANTNRTNLTLTGNGAGTTGYCYNAADQLVSTTAIPAGAITYDDHGNTVQLSDSSYDFDSADRQTRTETPTTVTSYRRDPLDRIAQRTDSTRITNVATTTAATATASVTVNQPPGTQAGDVIVASVAATALLNPGAINAAGWTVAGDITNGTGRTFVLWRYATATDPANWTFTVASATAVTAALSSYRNPATGTPIGVTATATTTLSTTEPLPQVTTTSDANQLIHVVGFSGNVTSSAPAGTTQRASIAASASLLVADRYQSRPGTSTALSATSSLALSSASITVALMPTTTSSRLGYTGHNDNSGFVQNVSGVVVGLTIPLVGGTTYDIGPTGVGVWSHANLHGDTVTTTDANGNRTWTGYWGPYGEAASGTPPANTTLPGASYGYNGQQQRLTDRNIIQMGARPYQPTLGRFLSVDPQQGGCANNYTYAFGDPTNNPDLNGQGFGLHTITGWAKTALCFITHNWESVAGVVVGAAGVLTAALGGSLGIAIGAAVLGGILSVAGAYSACRGGDSFGCALGIVGAVLSAYGIGLAVLPMAAIAAASGELADYIIGVGGGLAGIGGLVAAMGVAHPSGHC